MNSDAVLSISDLSKQFGGHLALDRVSLDLRAGQIRGLVGENGAGKSTLIKMLAGIHVPDGGTIAVAGHQIHPHSSTRPIAFVHQDLGLVDELSVAENIAFAMGFPKNGALINWKLVRSQATEAYERMGLASPRADLPVGRLLPAEKALLGIVRALAGNTQVAVLDEPTASLPAPDVAYLLDALRNLRASGTAILYVTHRLQELFDVADDVTVLRGGRKVAEGAMRDFTVDQLVGEMLGREMDRTETIAVSGDRGEAIVTVREVVIEGAGPVSFEIHRGEILGVVGLRGAGQERLGRALAGEEPYLSGDVTVHGKPVDRKWSLRKRMQAGIALLPADRQRESTVPGLTLVDNLYPGDINASGSKRWISHKSEQAKAKAMIDEYDVRPARPELFIEQLSGGNQQKVCVARVLGPKQDLVVLEEPTAGVDVGSKFDIHGYVRRAAEAGTAVIVVSSDFEEVAQLCTRALIVVHGAITAEISAGELTEDRMIVLASSEDQTVGAQMATR